MTAKLLHNTSGSAILVGPGVVGVQQKGPDCWWVGSAYITDSESEALKLKARYEQRRIEEHMAKKSDKSAKHTRDTSPKNAKNKGRKDEDDDEDEDEDEDDEDAKPAKGAKRAPKGSVKGGKVNSDDDDDDEDEDEDEDEDDEDEPDLKKVMKLLQGGLDSIQKALDELKP